jgi:hypothetical protein
MPRPYFLKRPEIGVFDAQDKSAAGAAGEDY